MPVEVGVLVRPVPEQCHHLHLAQGRRQLESRVSDLFGNHLEKVRGGGDTYGLQHPPPILVGVG